MEELDPFQEGSADLRNAFLDLFRAVHERKRGVVVASSQRCGTHLIGAYLRATGVGVPGEHFLSYLNARVGKTAEFEQLKKAVEQVIVGGSGGASDAFSVVLMRYAQKIGDDLEALGLARSLLSRSMENLTWIWLRRDWVDVAVSHYFAEKTGVWESRGGEHIAPPYDAAGIHRWWWHVQVTDAFWERYFAENAITPIELDYAQLVKDPLVLTDAVSRAGGNPALLSAAVPPPRMPHAQCKQDYAARFRDYLAERRSAELFKLHSAGRRSNAVA